MIEMINRRGAESAEKNFIVCYYLSINNVISNECEKSMRTIKISHIHSR